MRHPPDHDAVEVGFSRAIVQWPAFAGACVLAVCALGGIVACAGLLWLVIVAQSLVGAIMALALIAIVVWTLRDQDSPLWPVGRTPRPHPPVRATRDGVELDVRGEERYAWPEIDRFEVMVGDDVLDADGGVTVGAVLRLRTDGASSSTRSSARA